MYKMMINKKFAFAALFLLCGGMVWGQSTPSEPLECGEWQWPAVQSPCPEVQVKQKHDHTPKPQYRHYGWDTVIDCNTREGIVLSCMPYIPVQYFNGTYTVDEIPYNPPDTTFCLTYGAALANMNDPNRKKMPISTDDDFAASSTSIPYPFYFFGIRKNYFRLGANGLVTFTTDFGSGTHCPWSYSAALPWTPTSSGTPSDRATTDSVYFNRMHDAIYGVYEDTYPSPSVHGTTGDPNWGIYYGVIDEFPCRKIICSWNDVPQFSCTSMRCTYQIVCYEGSNIIEVHVKQRQVCTSWNHGGKGIIGIQNATGLPQVRPNPVTASNGTLLPNAYVNPGSPAAFYPTGYNTFETSINNMAFRFTPQGQTAKVSIWYRIFDDGRDSVLLPVYDPVNSPEAMNDTNGYVIPMDPNSSCPTLTKAYIRPTIPSKYVYHLRFQNANGDWYRLYDTVFVGIDTVNDLDLVKTSSEGDPHVLDICQGRTATMSLKMTDLQDIATSEWHVYRELNGEQTELPNSVLQFGFINVQDTVKILPVTLNTNNLPSPGTRNKIDSIYIRSIVDFTSGCHNNDLILLRVFPNFDTVITDGICRGETYTWGANGQEYTENTDPATTSVTLTSTPGCDSTVHLNLTVFDVSHTVDYINDCKPITWLNGETYTQTNTATTERDTVVLKNRYDCDSVVQLNFTLYPLTARLHSNVEQFTFDNLDAVLTDISTNGNGRVWKLPSMPDQTTPTAYYSIPVEMDGAEILLIESSEYGCVDTASIYIPFNKENFWVPNIFTPDNPAGNNTFGSVSSKTLYQEMLIYNRRGELVFRCNEPDCTWDGRDLNGNPCVQDAYVYIIRYTNEFEPQKTKVKRGTVTLLR